MERIKHVIGAFVIASLIFLIVLLKGYTFSGFSIVYCYTILITTFMLSRVGGSFFYKSHSRKMDSKFEPSVTFVIPCKNEEKAIFNTIQKCFEVDYSQDKIEIIAINDGVQIIL